MQVTCPQNRMFLSRKQLRNAWNNAHVCGIAIARGFSAVPLPPGTVLSRDARMRSPGRFLLFVFLVVVGLKLSEQAYALVAFRDERAQARVLRERLLQTGEELVAARAEFDTLKQRLEGEDAKLQRELAALRRFTRMGPLTRQVYDRYERERLRYNVHVEERNHVAREWEASLRRHEEHAERYNHLADSLQALAVRMGEPYYQVPTALEAAEERRRRESQLP